jgi:hypothetical protein
MDHGVSGDSEALKTSGLVVMSPGVRITATTPEGKIAITAVGELTRYGIVRCSADEGQQHFKTVEAMMK